MTRRISSSRPMTGSSLPWRASCGQVAAVLAPATGRSLSGFCAGDALAAAHLLQRLVDAGRG